jgi:hypothetical protein
MEYLEVGDLFVYLYKRPPLPEAEAKEIAYQILDGLSMMHENGFAHRDLKPNVGELLLQKRKNSLKRMSRISLSNHTLQINGGSSSPTLVSPSALKKVMGNRRR